MMKKAGVLLVSVLLSLCGCNSNSDNSMKDYKQYGDVINDFIPEIGQTKLLFKHSLED